VLLVGNPRLPVMPQPRLNSTSAATPKLQVACSREHLLAGKVLNKSFFTAYRARGMTTACLALAEHPARPWRTDPRQSLPIFPDWM